MDDSGRLELLEQAWHAITHATGRATEAEIISRLLEHADERERLQRPGETCRLCVPAFLHFGPPGTPTGGGVAYLARFSAAAGSVGGSMP